MKTGFNRDHFTVHFEIENEEDLLNAYQLEKLIKTSDWAILMMAWANIRMMFEDAIKKVTPSEKAKEIRHMQCSAFNGFDEAISVAGKIVEAAKSYRDERKKEFDEKLMEDRNETGGGSESEPQFAS